MDIFVSYRMDDSPRLAREIVRLLTKAGWEVWYAPLVEGGAHIPTDVDGKLPLARRVLGLWSRTAHLSPDVHREFAYASAKGNLIPCVTDDVTRFPDEYRADKIVLNLSRLAMHGYAHDLPQLLRGLVRDLGLPPAYDTEHDLISSVLDRDFTFHQIGNLTVPAKYLFCDAQESFSPEDVVIFDSEEVHEQRGTYPPVLSELRDEFLQRTLTHFGIPKIQDNVLPRLDAIRHQPELADDARGKLELYFSRTTYGQIWATNVAADFPYFDPRLQAETTIRKALCTPPYSDLAVSPLSNNPSVEVVLISDSPEQTPRRQMLIRQRSPDVAGFKNWYQAAASGHLAMGHRDADGKPSPFVGAVEEARQEIARNLELRPEDYRLIGVVLKEQDLYPSFIGYVETSRPVEDLLNAQARDRWEGERKVVPFEPGAIFRHIGDHDWFPSSVMAIIATLEAFFPFDEIKAAAQAMKPKPAHSFYLDDNFISDTAAETFREARAARDRGGAG